MDGVYNSKHGDDMKLVLYCTNGWALKKRGDWGGRSPPICKHVMIRASLTAHMVMT